MKMRLPGMNGFAGYCIARGIQAWMSTMRYEGFFETPEVDPLYGVAEPRIYTIWHESILAPIYLRAHCKMALLISKHRDADLLVNIARSSGFEVVRGSSKKGGSEALRDLAEHSRGSHIVFTPDGPRGPRRVAAPGPVILATRTGLPIVPITFGYDNAWRLGSWDRFAVPKPFSTVRVWIGAPIEVPMGLDRDGVEQSQAHLQSEMDRCTSLAEGWAAGAEDPVGAKRLFRDHFRGTSAEASPPTSQAA